MTDYADKGELTWKNIADAKIPVFDFSDKWFEAFGKLCKRLMAAIGGWLQSIGREQHAELINKSDCLAGVRL